MPLREALLRRLDLLREPAPLEAGGPHASLLLAEFREIAAPIARCFRDTPNVERARSPCVVMLLPGLVTRPARMRYMARQLERAGHKVKQWGQGFNLGPNEQNLAALVDRVESIERRYGQQVVLVGWSLGGIFARELAKLRPELVEKVITMGSPFSGAPYANNAWRVYELITGHSVAAPPISVDLAGKPPVETVALWSARDGVVSPRSACGRRGERDRAIALRCRHLGFGGSDEVIAVLLRELDRS